MAIICLQLTFTVINFTIMYYFSYFIFCNMPAFHPASGMAGITNNRWIGIEMTMIQWL